VAGSGAVVLGRERRQHPAHHLRAQDPHCHRGNREDDSTRAGSGGVPETAGPQRHRPVADGVHVVPSSGPRRGAEIDGPDEFYVVLLDNGRTRLLPDRGKRPVALLHSLRRLFERLPGIPQDRRHSFRGSTRGPSAPLSRRNSWGSRTSPLCRSLPACAGRAPRCARKDRYSESAAGAALGREKRRRPATSGAASRNWRSRLSPGLMTHPRLYEMPGSWRLPWRRRGDGWIKSVPAPMNVGPLRRG